MAVCAFNKGKLKVMSIYSLHITIFKCTAFKQVLAKSYQLEVGGRYFDEHLVNHFAEEFNVRIM